MADDSRHYGLGPFVVPPARSELKRRVDALKASSVGYELPDTIEGCVILWAEDLVVQLLLSQGMPAELWAQRPPWLTGLVDMQVAMLREEAARREPKSKRRGRPPHPNNFANSVLMGEWLRQKEKLPADARPNAIFQRTAEALGPGITRDHVRRNVEFHMRLFGRMRHRDPDLFQAVLVAMTHLDREAIRLRQPPARNLAMPSRF